MLGQQEREIRRFQAADDQGRTETVIEFKMVDLRQDVNGNLHDLGPPFRCFRLSTGDDVNQRPDGTYEVVLTRRLLKELGQTSEGEQGPA